MLTVRLHGHLEEKYGSEFKFAASTVREVIDALQANFDDFTEEFIKDMRTYSLLSQIQL
jgi:predicted phage tail protein